MDWLTFTCSQTTADSLLAVTRPYEAGYSKPGFERTEERECLGGRCWRRWKPRAESKRFGLDYESWEWSGGDVADWAGRHLRGQDGYATRADVAWDFSVPDDLTPDDVVRDIQAWCDRSGIGIGIAGENNVNTRYVGSRRNSDRCIRIYRKDRQDANVLFQCGPVMRVELILKGDMCRAWWSAYSGDLDAGIRAAAGHVLAMTGRAVQEEWCEPPTSVLPEVEVSGALFALMSQYGAFVSTLEAAGVDVRELADVAHSHASAATKRKWKKIAKQWAGLDLVGAVAMVKDRLRGMKTIGGQYGT